MPKNGLPRYKVIRSRYDGKIIARIDRSKYPDYHVPPEVILKKIRDYYKKEHPILFKRMVKKSVTSRKK